MPGATSLIRKPLHQMWGMTAVCAPFLTSPGRTQAHKKARGKHRPEYWGCNWNWNHGFKPQQHRPMTVG
jgi:hypothetical protein